MVFLSGSGAVRTHINLEDTAVPWSRKIHLFERDRVGAVSVWVDGEGMEENQLIKSRPGEKYLEWLEGFGATKRGGLVNDARMLDTVLCLERLWGDLPLWALRGEGESRVESGEICLSK